MVTCPAGLFELLNSSEQTMIFRSHHPTSKRRHEMGKVVVTAQVEDTRKWEAGFRTHGELFRNTYGVSAPIGIAISTGNQVAVCFEAPDVQKLLSAIETPATAEAMAYDGVKRETVKIYVMDKEFQP
jgi:hypothetical protein